MSRTALVNSCCTRKLWYMMYCKRECTTLTRDGAWAPSNPNPPLRAHHVSVSCTLFSSTSYITIVSSIKEVQFKKKGVLYTVKSVCAKHLARWMLVKERRRPATRIHQDSSRHWLKMNETNWWGLSKNTRKTGQRWLRRWKTQETIRLCPVNGRKSSTSTLTLKATSMSLIAWTGYSFVIFRGEGECVNFLLLLMIKPQWCHASNKPLRHRYQRKNLWSIHSLMLLTASEHLDESMAKYNHGEFK